MTKLSVVIPWANRDELAHTLRSHARLIDRHAAELVVVDCGGDPGRCELALTSAAVPVTLVEVPTDVFNKSLALNLGVHAALGEALLLLDTDVILDEDCVGPALAAVQGRDAFVTIERVRESSPSTDPIDARGLHALGHIVELVTGDGRKVWVETNRRHFDDGSRSGPGLVFLRREHFVAVDGMNSDLRGWGWEDVDLVARLQLTGTAERIALGAATHLSHGDDLRSTSGTDRHVSERQNFAVCVANYRLGHLRGTFADDVETCAELITIRRWTPTSTQART
jgi:GT2 family glycosyltransferase